MGIALTPGANSPEVQALVLRAQRGDKQAQLELGIRCEEGNGVVRDVNCARKLYRMAATPSGGVLYVYVPAASRGGKGYVAPVDLGLRIVGLEEARKRLQAVQLTQEFRENTIVGATQSNSCPATSAAGSFEGQGPC